MEKIFYEKILKQLENPSRVQICFFDAPVSCLEGYQVIMSKGNTNDTVGWFRVNSEKLEKYLTDNGKSWAYCIERDNMFEFDACIYMFIGIDLNAYPLYLPFPQDDEYRSYILWPLSFANLSKKYYERKPTAIEKALFEKATDVFKVLEP